MKITRIHSQIVRLPTDEPLAGGPADPGLPRDFVTVKAQTDEGVEGVGVTFFGAALSGTLKHAVDELGALAVGEDPRRTEAVGQKLRAAFAAWSGPGGIAMLAFSALDMALWDIKGKALGVPVYELLGGLARDHIECYSTGFPWKGNLKETAHACVGAGFRAFRHGVADPPDRATFNSQQMVRKSYEECVEIREGVGKDGDWAIDYHTRLDMSDAIRLSTLIEPLEPYFCEDLIRSENPGVYRELRQQVKVPIAVGEHFGARWDTNELIEQHLIDYSRVSIPNVGGITEYMKIAALCETHYVGLIPHFTGPLSEAALVHACGTFSGPVLMEMLGDGTAKIPHLPECFDFRDGKMWPNRRPGLGVTLDTKPLQLVAEITERARPIPMFHRPDGSITNW
jgi:L-alanine-DL-glutamate epimerase-like enolase superfamily enzyme